MLFRPQLLEERTYNRCLTSSLSYYRAFNYSSSNSCIAGVSPMHIVLLAILFDSQIQVAMLMSGCWLQQRGRLEHGFDCGDSGS